MVDQAVISATRRPGEIENGVLFGLDDILFLAGGSHSVLDIVSEKKSVSEASYKTFENNIEHRANWAAWQSIPYLHVIFPDKQSIVPEHWPIGSPFVLGKAYLDRISKDRPVLYPLDILAKQASKVISKVDTHLTDYGSIIVTGQIVSRLMAEPQDGLVERLLATLTEPRTFYGDLGSKLEPPISATQLTSAAQPPGRHIHNNLSGGNNGLIDLRFCQNPKYNKRILVFGDSFVRDVCRFLQFWFREVIFLRTPFFDPDIAALCKPDFLLTENVERYLDDVQSDEMRPNFFMYPFLKGESYSPSTEFASTFSAILSVSRPPYKDFYRAEFVDAAGRSSGDSSRSGLETFPLYISMNKKDGVDSDLGIVEPIKIVSRLMPEFIDNQSEKELPERFPLEQDIHGTFLVKRTNVLLFGPSIQVKADGRWACESRAYGEQFIDMVCTEGFRSIFPGSKPSIEKSDDGYSLSIAHMEGQIQTLSDPIFLATPLEPNNWGRWIATLVPKITDFRMFGTGRKLLCQASLPWQKSFLNYLGINADELVVHEPGQTYFCNDLMTVEYSVTNMTISEREKRTYVDLRNKAYDRICKENRNFQINDRIYVSRRTISKKHPDYRVLQNEGELIDRLEEVGFEVIEPEKMNFDEQLVSFGNAKIVVSLGGAALYNAVFCAPGTVFITLESSDYFIRPHCELLSSLDLRYGALIGAQDTFDLNPIHRRWSVDVHAVLRRVLWAQENLSSKVQKRNDE